MGVGRVQSRDEGAEMPKDPKKAKGRKIKDLKVDAGAAKDVKGGRDLVPEKKSVYSLLSRIAKPKS